MKMKDICKLDLPNIPVRKNNYFRKIYESIITSLIAFNIILFIIPNINSVILNLIFSIICVATSMFITNKIANKIQVFCFYNFEVKKIKALGYEICNECDGYGFQKFENKHTVFL